MRASEIINGYFEIIIEKFRVGIETINDIKITHPRIWLKTTNIMLSELSKYLSLQTRKIREIFYYLFWLKLHSEKPQFAASFDLKCHEI